MEIITIESVTYNELVQKIDTIYNFVVNHTSETNNEDEMWIDSYEVRKYLKISERTLQRLRSKKIISYSIISGKSYYTISEIRRMLEENKIHSKEENLHALIDNYKMQQKEIHVK